MLTAAHCVDGSDFKVHVNLTIWAKKSAAIFAMVTETKPHPDYFTADIYHDINATAPNDIALLKLDRQILSVDPVDLNSDPTIPADSEEVEVFGHGRLGDDLQFAPNLQVVTVAVVPNDVCIAEYAATDRIRIDAELHVCTALPGKSPCTGDSGGPLVLEREGMPDLQVATVSFAQGCAREGFSNVYARVSTYFDWIRTGICELTTGNIPDYCSTLPTASPVTAAPVTSPSASVGPVTPVPNSTPTAGPTASPVTPPTDQPVTDSPISSAPVVPPPKTEAPITFAPVTPPTDQPVTDSPISLAPVVSPKTEAPITFAPVTSPTDRPVTESPISVLAPVAAPKTEAPSSEGKKTGKKEGKKK